MIVILVIIFIIMILLWLFYFLQWYSFAYYFAYTIIIVSTVIILLIFKEAYRVIFKGNAPYLRTSNKMIKRILEEVDFNENSVVYDLGCGDGRFLRELLKQKKVKAIGYEYFILPCLIGWFLNITTRNKVKIYYQDFFKADLSQADYIFSYLISGEMPRLEEKLKKELKPGALVIANTFSFKNWQPEKFILIDEKKPNKLSNKLRIYRKQDDVLFSQK